jgi:hypothetical protein
MRNSGAGKNGICENRRENYENRGDGGSGLIGSKLVPKLREQGHEAVAASPKSGVNTLTGEGLAEALKSASVVVDVSNAPSWEDAAVTRNQPAGGQFVHPLMDKIHSPMSGGAATPPASASRMPDVTDFLKNHPAPNSN